MTAEELKETLLALASMRPTINNYYNGTINHKIDHVDTINNNYYDSRLQSVDADDAPAADVAPPPAVLTTPEAMRLWQAAQAEGWVSDSLQPLMSIKKASILASVISDSLHLTPRWQPFEQLWGVTDLASSYSQATLCKYYPELMKKFRREFECGSDDG